jgi:hypothetical protein
MNSPPPIGQPGAIQFSPVPMPMPTSPETALQIALGNPTIPKVYGNTFANFVGSHDVTILFGVNGVASGVLSLSYPLAKALATKLTEAITKYEAATKTVIPSADALDEDIKAIKV